MVTITDYKSCTSQDGREFFAITMQGEVTVNQSQNGGFYLTANKASMPTSFSEAICQSLIGKQLAGSIQKVPCEAYDFTNATGETVTLNFRYQYSPKEDATVKQGLNPVTQQQNAIPFMPFANSGQVMAAA